MLYQPGLFSAILIPHQIASDPRFCRVQRELPLLPIPQDSASWHTLRKQFEHGKGGEEGLSLYAYSLDLKTYLKEYPLALKLVGVTFSSRRAVTVFASKDSDPPILLGHLASQPSARTLTLNEPIPDTILIAVTGPRGTADPVPYLLRATNGPLSISEAPSGVSASAALFLFLPLTAIVVGIYRVASDYLERRLGFDPSQGSDLAFKSITVLGIAVILPIGINLLIDIFSVKPFTHELTRVGPILQSTFFGAFLELLLFHVYFLKRTVRSGACDFRLAALLILMTEGFGCLFFLNLGIAGDGAEYVSWIRSLVIDHDLDFANEAREIAARGWRDSVRGLMALRLMTPLAWLPGYAAAHLLETMGHWLGLRPTPDGYSGLYVTAIVFVSVTASFLGALVCFKSLCRIVSPLSAYLGTVLGYMGTAIWTWTFVHPSYTQAVDFFFVSLTCFSWLVRLGSLSLRDGLIPGLSLGCAILAREQNVLFVLLFLSELLLRPRNLLRTAFAPMVRKAVGFLVGVLIPLTPVLLADALLPGLFVHRYGSSGYMFTLGTASALLFSSVNGLLTTTPLINLSLLGLSLFFLKKNASRKWRAMCATLTLITVLQFFLGSIMFVPSFDEFNLGQRYFVNSTPLWMLGLALFLDSVRDRPSRLFALLTVSVLLCLFYLFLNFQYQGHVMEYLGHGSPWRQILYQQFFSVPQLIPAVLSDEIYWSLPKGVMGFVSVRAAVHNFPPVALILWMCWYCLRRVLVQKSDPGRCSARC